MFSAGNITEKLRVAGMDCEGQTVVDLFAGNRHYIYCKTCIYDSVAEWIPGRRNDPTGHTESPYLNKRFLSSLVK